MVQRCCWEISQRLANFLSSARPAGRSIDLWLFEGWQLSSDMVRWLYNSSTNEFIHVITEEYFKDPWLSLSSHYSRDSTRGDLPKEETAGVQPIATTPFPTAAFNPLISPSTPPFCFSSQIPQTIISHSEAK